MTAARIALPLALALAFGAAFLAVAPRGFEAQELFAVQDDPAALADHALNRNFSAEIGEREISEALAAGDAELAQSFVELARERNVTLDPLLLEKVEAANRATEIARKSLQNFARGLITGESDDVSSLAGTALGDLFVIGDIRDAVREGTRLAAGEPADELVLGLAGMGIAVTAATYVTAGTAAPARLGLTVIKAARKSGRIGARLGSWISRSAREVVDWAALRRGVAAAGITEPALALRAAREAVKVEKSQSLVQLVKDVGRVQAKAGTGAALEGLKLAEGPRDVSRLARLATVKGGKTRAILKLLGRAAIVLTASLFNLASWIFSALVTLIGLVAGLKRSVERATERYCAHRKRRARARERERGRTSIAEPIRVPQPV